MNRRCFIQWATLTAAHSALGGTLVGCGAELNIPCLGPAASPMPVAGMTYIKASDIGCALDCKLATGRNKYTGGSATDDGPRINAALAGATAANPITLIMDGSALISGLFLPAGGFWNIAGLGCGTGFFIKTGTNNDGIHNGGPNAAVPSDPGPPAPPRGMNVSLSNFTINGNSGNGKNGNSTSGLRQGKDNRTWYFGINLMNLDNVRVENLVLVNMPAYHIRFSNVGHVSATGCVMRSFGVNTDGLHFDGPANDITISNCNFTMGDDSIALNAPEGYSGNISRVAVSHCTFNSWSLMRLYTINASPNFTIDTVSVNNCSGTFYEGAFLIGLYDASSGKSIASLTISDCSVTCPAVLGIGENFGSIVLNNVTFIPSLSQTSWHPGQSNRACGFVRPPPPTGVVPYVGASLSFNDCVIQRNSDIDALGVILEKGSMIGTLEWNGLSVKDFGSYRSLSKLLDLESGSINQLVINSVNNANTQSLVARNQFSSIGSVTGAGVLATGWEFPDVVMANEIPYISANSGLPSIKVGGVVEPYLSRAGDSNKMLVVGENE